MSLVLGCLLAAGLVLCASPWLWPPREPAVVVVRTGATSRLLEEAGFTRGATRSLAVTIIVGGAGAAAAVWLLTKLPVLAALAALAGAAAPVLYLRGRRLRLRRARRQLWPDVCDLLVAAIRVGLSLPDAVASLAESAPQAVRPAFAVFARDVRVTGRFETSLDSLKASLADPIADRIIETLRMARQVGGTELVGVLRALSASVRADAALRGEVEARQSWIRGAAVLGSIAPWAILGLLVMRPEGAHAYSTPQGVAVIAAGAVVSVIAYRIMLRVGRLAEPERWFG